MLLDENKVSHYTRFNIYNISRVLIDDLQLLGRPSQHSPVMSDSPDIQVQNLSYKFQDGSPGLTEVGLDLPAGSRTLLIGGT